MTSEFTIAVHALVYLNHKAQLLSSEALAKNICTNPARVRKIMTKLKKAGFVSTKEGAEGGYRMLKAPQELNLLAVADAVEAKFVTASWHSGDTDMDCLVASGMAGIMDRLCVDLDGICRERLEQIHLSDIDKMIFKT